MFGYITLITVDCSRTLNINNLMLVATFYTQLMPSILPLRCYAHLHSSAYAGCLLSRCGIVS